ncbi:MAG: trypsin-like peptidase domain-containing protein [Elusimicrobia bacterium]|nr:trypsin-like peptidase domain-containing protein [Elusimicrobiota bacterium]
MQRSLATLLCAALCAGLWPDTAAAQFAVRGVRAGGTVATVGLPAAAAGASLNAAAASLGAPAPSVSPAPGLLPSPVVAVQSRAAAVLSAAVPSAAAASPAPLAAAALPASAITAMLPAAAPSAAPVPLSVVADAAAPRPGTPSAAVAGTLKTIRRFGTGPAAASGRLFENSSARPGAVNPVKVPAAVGQSLDAAARGVKWLLAASPLGRLLPTATAESWGRAPPPAPEPKHALSDDEFGGPPALKTASDGSLLHRAVARLSRDLAYGAKWAVSMFGIASLLQITLKPLAAMLPWQLWIPQSALGAFGRVELLTGFGPADVTEAVAEAPLSFLGLALPYSVLVEELTYRLLSFGLAFAVLAAARPAALAAVKFLDNIPDLFGLRSAAQWALGKLAGVSSYAFPLAAFWSAASFAVAHFAAWGVAPHTLILHLTLGAALAWTAYRSRGLIAPFTAHLGYNLLAIAVGTAAPLWLLPQYAVVVAIVAGILSAAVAYYQWRAWRKDKAAARAAALGLPPPVPAPFWRRVAGLSGLAAFLVAVSVGTFYTTSPTPHPPTLPVALLGKATPAGGLPPGAALPAAAVRPTMTVEALVQKVKPSVVMVRTPTGSGSGFIISADGLLVTNGHVVAAGESQDHLANSYSKVVKIRFANGREVTAAVVGYHATKDLALVQLPPNPFGWPYVPLGDSAVLNEGQEVAAMGYPRALPFSVSRGIISGTDFRSNGWVDYLQHDAAVNPGNSGGPLFNMSGEVIGVNSMIMTESGGFDGISYAITSADVQKALDQYATVGNISPAWLGVILERSGGDAPLGVRIDAVRPGSPAAAAGLEPGDLLIGLDGGSVAGDPVRALGALSAVLRSKTPNEILAVQVYRAGAVITLSVNLGRK